MNWRGRLARSLERITAPDARRLRAACPGVEVHPSLSLLGDVVNIRIGSGSQFGAHVELHGGGQEWCEGVGCIEMGAGSSIAHGTTLWGAGPGGLHIGRRFDCGPGVVIVTSTSRNVGGVTEHDFAAVTIGDDVVIYANATVILGVTIGDGARIGAGAVVTRDVPAGTLVVGVPARVVVS